MHNIHRGDFMRIGLRRRRYRGVFIAVVIIMAILVLTYMLLKRLEPVFLESARIYAEDCVTAAVNESSAKIFKEHYPEGFQESQGDMLITNTPVLNTLKSELTLKLRDELPDKISSKIEIPLGSASGIYLLNGLGPDIPVFINPISSIKTDFEDEFTSQGINYVKHSIYINVSVKVKYVGFLLNSSNVIETKVPVIENISSGTVPNYYGSMGILD